MNDGTIYKSGSYWFTVTPTSIYQWDTKQDAINELMTEDEAMEYTKNYLTKLQAKIARS